MSLDFSTEIGKQYWIDIAQDHQDRDRYIQGAWLRGKIDGMYSGCFYGCMTQQKQDCLSGSLPDVNDIK